MALNNAEASFFAIDRELSSRWSTSELILLPGVELITQGRSVDQVWLIISGMVKLSFVEQYGGEVISNLRSAGCIVGAEAALLEESSLVTATTVTSCQVRHFPADGVRHLLQSSATLAFHMSRTIARETLDQTTAMMDATSGKARQRLVHLLRQLSVRRTNTDSGSLPSIVPLKRHELAKLLAVTPEHLSRLIRILQHEGILHREKRGVVLQNTKPTT
jgi:CRP-like cAMP-binding protein